MPAASGEQPTPQQQAAQEPQESAAGRPQWQGTTPEHCQQMIDRSTSRNPMVKFMLEKLGEVGTAAPPPRELSPASSLPAWLTNRCACPPSAPQMNVQAGCAVGKEFVAIEKCDLEVGGGFRPPDGVVICHNHLASQVGCWWERL